MTAPFLAQVAQNIYQNHGTQLDKVSVVFPNRRSLLFYKQHLAQLLKKPIWNSENLPIAELIESKTKLVATERLQLIALLYKHFKAATKTTESFDDFYFWGEMLLSDFDSIDKYLVDAAQLFSNVQNLKEIELHFESFGEEELAEFKAFWESVYNEKIDHFKETFLHIWKILHPVYQSFKEDLREQKLAYDGMLYRELVENFTPENWEKEKYIFVGFNALSSSEIRLFDLLQKEGKAEFYWDYDLHYTQIPKHEAGYFIREFIKRFPPNLDCHTDNFQNNSKEINIIACPSAISQTKYLSEYLKEHKLLKDNRTAIMLADEGLLVPLLHAVNPEELPLNVTMGYPMLFSNTFAFVEAYLKLCQNRRITKEGSFYYHKDVQTIFKSQLLADFDTTEARDALQQAGYLYCSKELITENLEPDLGLLFNQHTKPADFLLDFKQLIGILYTKATEVEQEFLYRLNLGLQAIEKLLDQGLEFSNKLLLNFIGKVLRNQSVRFEDFSTQHTQVMGILESRSLDFENIIVLSLNEGIFPHINPAPSFIPVRLRSVFKLPTIEHQDSIFAYYFYRMLQRAKHVCFMHNADPGSAKMEESRFIKQIAYETKAKITRQAITIDFEAPRTKAISIAKDEAYFKELQKLFKDGISASALNTYIDCPLRYYYKYIKKLKLVGDQEGLDALQLGNLFHDTADAIYSELKHKPMLAEELEKRLNDTAYLDEKLAENAPKAKLSIGNDAHKLANGKAVIIRDLVKDALKKLLEKDLKVADMQIIDLEMNFEQACFPELLEGGINISGIVDRIDKRGEDFYFVDYKTGKQQKFPKDIEGLFAGGLKHGKELFQCMLYAYALRKKYNQPKIAIYWLSDLFKPNFDPMIEREEEHYLDFEQELKNLFQKMLDPKEPIEQTEKQEVCTYCDFNSICH